MLEEGRVQAAGVELGFVRSASGSRVVVFVHGWPQTSYAWRMVMPLLGPDYTCVAFDLRGVGHSTVAVSGFDKASMAEDLYAALETLRLEDPVLVVGHGIGGMVAYSLARRLVLVDAPLPGLPGWEEAAASPAMWHLGFRRDCDEQGDALAEVLVAGRERVYARSARWRTRSLAGFGRPVPQTWRAC